MFQRCPYLFVFILAFACGRATAADFRAVTEDWPPFNYQREGRSTGFAIELLQAASSRLGQEIPAEFLPWERAYRIAQHEPNVLIFTMARKPEREALFKWVFPIAPRTIYLYKLAKRTDIQLKTIDDARHFKIATRGESDAATADLLRLGFQSGVNLDMLHGGSDENNLQKLVFGRVDLVAASELQLSHTARSLGRQPGEFERTVKLSDTGEMYYFAFSRGTPDALVSRVRKAFEGLSADGTVERIRRKYLN